MLRTRAWGLQDEADTVGCCSLRVEHLAFPSDHEVTFDFLGKDSMRYFQTIDVRGAMCTFPLSQATRLCVRVCSAPALDSIVGCVGHARVRVRIAAEPLWQDW
ncbi:hypothetical protein EON66_03245 [archaeon]|nr:MAG: hypothetical protein EON66_03245 [archaeon]